MATLVQADWPEYRRSAVAKAEMLSGGVVTDLDAISAIGYEYKENNYGYNNPNRTNDRSLLVRLPTELIMSGDVVCSFRYNPKASWRLRADSGGAWLENDETVIEGVKLSPRPAFWDMNTSSDRPMKDIGGVYGLDTVVFFVTENCEFFGSRVQCKFCNLNAVATGLKFNDRSKSYSEIAETYLASRAERYPFTNFIGGSFFDHDYEFRTYLDVIAACRSVTGEERIDGAIISMPPSDLGLLDAALECGISSLKFNLEVFDPQIFAQLMPGKAQYGRERMFSALKEAVKIYGQGSVYSNLLIGLEPVDSVIKGFEYLADIGVVPVGKTFHPDLGTPMSSHKTFSAEELLRAFRGLHEATRRAGVRPWLSPTSLRGSLAWEFERGYL
jgi:hypothetical protein